MITCLFIALGAILQILIALIAAVGCLVSDGARRFKEIKKELSENEETT